MFKQLKIAYSPGENFGLRDFHHAVNNLPGDAFLPEIDDSRALRSGGISLSFSDELLELLFIVMLIYFVDF